MEWLSNRSYVIRDNDRAEDGRDMKYLARRRFQIRVAHRGVRGAEVYRLRLNLFDAAP